MKKRTLLAGVGIAGLVTTQTFAAGVPVFDASNLVEWITSIGTQTKQYALQAKQYIVDGETLYGLVHQPALGMVTGLLNTTGLGSELPANPNAVMGLVNSITATRGGGFQSINGVMGALSGFAGTAYNRNHIYSPTDGSFTSQQLIANGNNIAGAQGAYAATTDDLQKHAATLQALRDHLATATTTKDVADTQAQIALEETWTQNETGQLAAAQAAYQTNNANLAQRENETVTKSFDQFVERANALPWN
jgi:type IV secretion system protein VirB5